MFDPGILDPARYPVEVPAANSQTVTVFSGAEVSRHRELRVTTVPGGDKVVIERWMVYSNGRQEKRNCFSLTNAEAEALRKYLDVLAGGRTPA